MQVRYKDDFEKLKRIEEISKEIAELKNELACLESYFTNKRKVKTAIGNKEKNGCKPLLGLFNKIVYHPSAYCELKQCYLLYDDMRVKSCYYKGCKHLIMLEENQKQRGLKNRPMKFYDIKCEMEGM